MDQPEWQQAVAELRAAADDMLTLARCLDVAQHLDAWRESNDVLEGSLAADGLDQALGLLDELAGGRAAALREHATHCPGRAASVARLTADSSP